MKQSLVVLFLLGAFLSVAGLQKVFSVEEVVSDANVFSVATPMFDYLSTDLPSQESSNSALLLDNFLSTIVTDDASPSPVPDFCQTVPVLMYHHTQPMEMATLLGHPQLTIDSNLFDEHVRFFVENKYTIISAEDLINALRERRQLPPKTIVITIDDGYDDNYTYAFSTAKKYKIIINFMIPTDLIGRSGYMTWEHLKEMAVSPYARIYNHTATHAALGYSSPEQIETELSSSSVALKEHLGLENTIFTYPYGSFSDFAIAQVKKHGFIGAFSTIDGTLQCSSQIMALPRTRIGNAPLNFYGY